MKIETKLLITFALLMLLGAMAYFYTFNGQIQGRFTTTPDLEQSVQN